MARWNFEQHLVAYVMDRCPDKLAPLTVREMADRLGLASADTLEIRARNYRWIRTEGREGLKGSGKSGKQKIISEFFAVWTGDQLRELVSKLFEGESLESRGIDLTEVAEIMPSTPSSVEFVRETLQSLGDLATLSQGTYKFSWGEKHVDLRLLDGSYDPADDILVWEFDSRPELEEQRLVLHHPLIQGVLVFRWRDIQKVTCSVGGQKLRLELTRNVFGELQFNENPTTPVDERFFIHWEDVTTDLIIHLFPPTLRPKARLMSILGEQLIKDNTIGLMELVKNAYDADAECVTVLLEHLHDVASTRVVIEDDGFGMSREMVVGPFLEPASGHKELQKKRRIRTPKGRLPLGEKGVGRFAANRLGHRLMVITRAIGASREVVLNIDWDTFEDSDAYLSEVPVSVYERVPMRFLGDQHGTRLEMVGAREEWTEGHVKKVWQQFQRMMSPFEAAADFKVLLKCPDFPKYEEMSPSDVLDKAHYVFEASVNEAGEMSYTYHFTVPGLPERTAAGVKDLRRPIKTWNPPSRRPACGPFKIYLYAWDRTLDMLKRSHTTREELNERCGISLFRQGIRILPYGEPGDDWLALDRKRIDTPAERIGNKNIIGYVEIDQVNNPDLIDKTNREGLIENDALADLRDLIGQAVAELELVRQDDRAKANSPSDKVPKQLLATVNDVTDAVQKVSALQEELKRAVEAQRPQLETSPEGRKIIKLVEQNPQHLTTVTAKTNLVTQVATDLQRQFDSQRDLLVSLAGFGLAAERFTHEFARLTKDADEALRSLIEEHPELAKSTYLSALRVALDALKNDIRSLGPLFYVRKGSSVVQIDVKDAIETAFKLHRGDIRKYRVDASISGISFVIEMREGPCVQVFNNLIDNAVYWILRTNRTDRRIVVQIDDDNHRVIFGDSGDGIDSDVASRLFQPFITSKQEGRGLGLYISREIMEEAHGTIRLATDNERISGLGGATFVIHFPNQQEGTP